MLVTETRSNHPAAYSPSATITEMIAMI